MAIEEESGLLYPIILTCVVLVITYFIYKLYSKVNELAEKIEGINQQSTETKKTETENGNENEMNMKKIKEETPG